MQVFLYVSAAALFVAGISADQSHHQAIKLGNAPSVSHAVHKPHFAAHAAVSSQPHAAPQSVHGYGGYEKPVTAVHAPAAVPYKAAPAYNAPVYHAPAPAYAAPVYHAPAPVYKAAPAPVYAPAAPVYKATPAPVYHAPAPAYKPAPTYAPAKPVYHAPAKPAYHAAEPEYNEPAVYAYNYAVADDYSGANFQAGENRDGYATSGSYSVALPDGRLQTVNYKVADAYSGYVADVTYSGEAKYAAAPAPYKAAPAYKPAPAYAPAPAYKPAPAYAPAPVYHA